MKLDVRVIRTYTLQVEAEYGETEADVRAKADALLADELPDTYSESIVVMPHKESEFATLEDYEAANVVPLAKEKK